MTAYYNEIDPYAADWLRNLIAAGHIAPGDVDTRSIVDVQPADLRGYSQCHFFAGIGVWSYALRRAGWRDDEPVWTGSCPCQPFSAAGRGDAFSDERHLWPAFHRLIAECRPPVVFGEQVASKVVDEWVDLVQDDLEALDYAFGAVPFPAASLGAPHIRDRLYWVADANDDGCATGRGVRSLRGERHAEHGRAALGVADAGGPRLEGRDARALGVELSASERDRAGAGSMADAGREHGRRRSSAEGHHGHHTAGRVEAAVDDQSGGALGDASAASPLHGFWRDADWLFCRDGRWRPVEPGTSPLAHGASARVGRLRAYGNAIVAEQAVVWIEEWRAARDERLRLTAVSGMGIDMGVFA